MMVGEVAQSPSQVKKEGRWRPIRRNTAPSIRPYPPGLLPSRRLSLRAFQSRRSLAPIQEYKTATVMSRSTGSLEDLIPTYLPTSWMSSSERLVIIPESPQLQQLQSVSLSFVEDTRGSEPQRRLYRTQSQWTRRGPAIDMPSSNPNSESLTFLEVHFTPPSIFAPPPETDAALTPDARESSQVEAEYVCTRHRLPREDIAELFFRAEEYDREHPRIVRDSGKVWVRANSIGNGLTKTLKTMGSLHKKTPSIEARLGPNVPVLSRLKCYEKPSRVKRMKIVVQDGWRKFRNRSTGRDTALQAERLAPTANSMGNISVVSLNLTPDCTVRPQMGHRRLSRASKPEGWEPMAYRGHRRKDSKHSTQDEPLKRRRSDLFLDI